MNLLRVPPKYYMNLLRVPPKYYMNLLKVPPKYYMNLLRVPPKYYMNQLEKRAATKCDQDIIKQVLLLGIKHHHWLEG